VIEAVRQPGAPGAAGRSIVRTASRPSFAKASLSTSRRTESARGDSRTRTPRHSCAL
jgi:hypothetical protein